MSHLISEAAMLIIINDLNGTEVGANLKSTSPVFSKFLPTVCCVRDLIDQTHISQCLTDQLVFVQSNPIYNYV